jgi:1-acyl-sn-glycerol-3-phosphate acyltransferase
VIYAVRYALIALYTVFWATIALVAAFVDRRGRVIVWVARRWIRWCLWSCGIRVDAVGLENVSPDRPCILMSNHQSALDIAAVVHTLPIPWKFVAKRELTRIPFFGWALAASDQIVVDRNDRESAVRRLTRAAERVRSGVNVIVFPEGTRSADARLASFKSGGFHLAIQAGVPIIPVSVSGSWCITPKGSLRIESGRILIRYGKPIPTHHLSIDDRNELKRQVREAILAGFDPELQGPLG